jgi:hypothetical protein
MQRAAILPFVASLAPPYFSTPSYKRQEFRGGGGEEEVTKNKMCVFILSTAFIRKSFILRRIQRDIVINVKTSSCKMPVIFVRFELKLNVPDRFSTEAQISNFIEIRLVEPELFDAD